MKNYNEQQHSYNTTYTDINVACESCHGAGSQHIALASAKTLSEENTGFSQVQPHLAWQFEAGAVTANPVGKKNHAEINKCGSCHSRFNTNIDEGTSPQIECVFRVCC